MRVVLPPNGSIQIPQHHPVPENPDPGPRRSAPLTAVLRNDETGTRTGTHLSGHFVASNGTPFIGRLVSRRSWGSSNLTDTVRPALFRGSTVGPNPSYELQNFRVIRGRWPVILLELAHPVAGTVWISLRSGPGGVRIEVRGHRWRELADRLRGRLAGTRTVFSSAGVRNTPTGFSDPERNQR